MVPTVLRALRYKNYMTEDSVDNWIFRLSWTEDWFPLLFYVESLYVESESNVAVVFFLNLISNTKQRGLIWLRIFGNVKLLQHMRNNTKTYTKKQKLFFLQFIILMALSFVRKNENNLYVFIFFATLLRSNSVFCFRWHLLLL